MPAGALTVFIVDDDGAVRDSLSLMLGLAGYRTAQFPDAESFLAAHAAEWTGCLIADLRLPGMTGLELQSELRRRGSAQPSRRKRIASAARSACAPTRSASMR
jgi:FixJ family two-component response regulator